MEPMGKAFKVSDLRGSAQGLVLGFTTEGLVV